MCRFPFRLLLLASLAAVPACTPEPATLSTTRAPSSPATAEEWLGIRDVPPVPSGYPVDGLKPQAAYAQKQDQVWVVGSGVVERILRDDTKPPRHQRFVVRITNEQTILIAHNIDVASRVPVKKGDRVGFRGEYAWNEQGGVVHWTHKSTRGRQGGGGWIVRDGQGYR